MELLFWIYLANAVLLIDHEIDSAYWKEWDLFRLKGGVQGFLLIHLPLLGAMLYGLVEVSKGTSAGLIYSLVLAGAGIFALSIHSFFIARGRKEFTLPVSIILLAATGFLSIFQMVITIRLMVA